MQNAAGVRITVRGDRIHFLMAVIADGRGDERLRVRQLDAAVANLKMIGPKVEWGSIVGQEYVRAGALEKAEAIARFITPLADSHNKEQSGYLQLLQGAVAGQKGETEKAITELTVTDPTYGRAVNSLALDTLAHTYQLAGNLGQAIFWYEKLASPWNGLTGWEEQQRWGSDCYQLAMDYQKRGQRDKAKKMVTMLLDFWKDADADLPLRKAAVQLEAQLGE